MIQDRIRARENWERQEKEREERERIAKIWKEQREQQEKRDREAAEALRKLREEEEIAELKRQEEEARKWQKNFDEKTKRFQDPNAYLPEQFFTAEGSSRQASISTCRHDGWWPKVQGRRACPKCGEIWTYLLQCPGCKIQACPRCQSTIRPKLPRNTARTNRRAPYGVRSSSPDFFDYY